MSILNNESRNGEDINYNAQEDMCNKKSSPASIFEANLVFFIVIVLYIAFQFVIRAFVNYYGIYKLVDNSYAILLIMEYGFILFPVLMYVFIKQKDIRAFFMIKKVPLLDVLLIVFMMISLSFTGIFFNLLIIYIIGFLGKVPYNAVPIPNSLPEYFLGVFVIAVTPAICEECLHRGLLLNAYLKKGYIKAIMLSSLFFGVFHFDLNNLMGPFILGLFIGYVVYKTGSIIAGMVAHFVNNFYSITMQYVFRKDLDLPKYISITRNELLASFIVACFLFSVIFLPLFFWFRHRNKKNNSFSNNDSDINSQNIDQIDVISDIKEMTFADRLKEWIMRIELKSFVFNYWPIFAIFFLYLLFNLIYLYSIAIGIL